MNDVFTFDRHRGYCNLPPFEQYLVIRSALTFTVILTLVLHPVTLRATCVLCPLLPSVPTPRGMVDPMCNLLGQGTQIL